jgi:hypothetical protein
MDLGKAIARALLTEGKVYLPGIGTLERVYHSAELYRFTNRLTPPQYTIDFSESRKETDASLAFYIAGIENAGDTDPAYQVKEFIEKILDKLKSSESYIIPDVGKFSLVNGVVSFKADEHSSIVADTMGFDAVYFQSPTSREAKGTEDITPTVPKKVKSVNRKHKMALIITGISIPLALVAAFVIYIIIENGTIENYSNKQPPSSIAKSLKEETNAKIQKRNALMYTEPITPEISPVIPQDTASKTEEVKTNVLPRAPRQVSSSDAPFTKFYLIAGSFKSSKNAERMKVKLEEEGFIPEILSVGDSIFRVTMKTFSNRDSAMHEWQRLMSEGDKNANIWLLSE